MFRVLIIFFILNFGNTLNPKREGSVSNAAY